MLTPNQIRGRLLMKDIKFVDIAQRFKISPTTVSIVVNGWGKSRRIQEYIADTLGMSFKEVWNSSSHKKAA